MYWIFAHGDGDGVSSAAIALAAIGNGKVFFSHPSGLLEDLKDNVTPGDNVVIVDIAINERHAREIFKLFEILSRRGELVYIDHHPEPISIKINELPGVIIHSEDACASELTYRYFEDKLPWEYNRLAIYGAISDYMADTDFIRKAISMWDVRHIYFEAGVLAQGLEGSRKMYDFKRHVVEHLSKNRLPSALSELLIRALIESTNEDILVEYIKKNVKTYGNIAYILDPPGSITRAATYARSIAKKPIGIAGQTKGNKIIMSLRTDRDDIDLNRILRIIAKKLNIDGGGHRRAAGARMNANLFKEFLSLLDANIRTN
ncbi:MAG: phosphoesterase [Thermoprotei archaeon]|nr:MAG: phosphoesterase [Thermoprotei archaeon]